MLKALIGKQFRECFRSYFVSPKTGKLRSKWSMVGMFVFFSALMLFLAGTFFGMCFMLGELMTVGFGWLYYAIMGLLAVLLGTFGSVFNTYSALYLAKDNELLLSMPIPPRLILITRMSLVYGLALLYSGIVWVPTMVYGWIFGSHSVASVVFSLVLCPMIALLVTVLTCALGWLVAVLATRMKNRSWLVVLLSLVFFGGYYWVCMNMSEFLMNLVTNAAAIGSGIQTWGNLLYQLGMAADGSVSSMLLFCGITLGLFVVCFAVLERTFYQITTRANFQEKKIEKVTVRAAGMQTALLRREWQHFVSSPTYMLNCGLGLVMLLAADVMSILRRDMMMQAFQSVFFLMPALKELLPVLVVAAVGMISGMNMISTPSVSLEGKTLWVLHMLPVSGWDVLRAKLTLHLLLNLPVTVFSAVIVGFCLGLKAEDLLYVTVCCAALVWVTGAFGLVIGVLHPTLSWTSETMPIKQSMNVFVSMVVGWLLPIMVAAAAFLLRDYAEVDEVLTGASVLLLFAGAWMTKWLRTKGAEVFEKL